MIIYDYKHIQGHKMAKDRFFRARISEEHFKQIEKFSEDNGISKTRLFELLVDKLMSVEIKVRTKEVFDGLKVESK